MNNNQVKIEALANRAAIDLIEFRGILDTVINKYEKTWYHIGRVARATPAKKHPRIADVKNLKDAVSGPKTATELKLSVMDYLTNRHHFKGAKLSPLRRKLIAAVEDFTKTHNLKTIDDHLALQIDGPPGMEPVQDQGRSSLEDTEEVQQSSEADQRIEMQRELNAARVQIAALRQQLAAPAVQKVKPAEGAAAQELAQARAQIGEKDVQIAELGQRLAAEQQATAAAQQATQRVQQQLEEKQTEVDGLEQNLGREQQAHLNTQQTLAESNARINQLNGHVRARDQMIAQQKTVIAEQQSVIAQLREKINSLIEGATKLFSGFTNLLTKASVDIKKAVGKSKLSIAAGKFRSEAREQFEKGQGDVFDRVQQFHDRESGVKVEALLTNFDRSRDLVEDAFDQAREIVLPDDNLIQPVNLIDMPVEVAAPQAVRAVAPKAVAPKVVAPKAVAVAVAPDAPAPPAPPAPAPAPPKAPPPPAATSPSKANTSVTLSKNPQSLVNRVGDDVRNNSKPASPAKGNLVDEIKGATLKKTEVVAREKKGEQSELAKALLNKFKGARAWDEDDNATPDNSAVSKAEW